MKPKAYVFLFEEYSDWEIPYALWAIARSEKFETVTVGFSKDAVKSQCALTVIPDVSIDEARAEDTAILIIPGGDVWGKSFPETIDLLRSFQKADVLIAAMCGGTLEAIRAGLAHGKKHTSNDLGYVKQFVEDYEDEALYVAASAVTDGNLITANGLSPIEFGREIILALGLYNRDEAKKWYEMCKNGLYWKEF